VKHAVVWNEDGGDEYVGRLEFGDGCILLSGRSNEDRAVERRLLIDELEAVELDRLSKPRGDHAQGLILVWPDLRRIELASLEAPGTLRELAESIAELRGKAAR
jgi:hypothetical protein